MGTRRARGELRLRPAEQMAEAQAERALESLARADKMRDEPGRAKRAPPREPPGALGVGSAVQRAVLVPAQAPAVAALVPQAPPNVAYRITKTKGVATGDQPESMYMVVNGKRYSAPCCFDYGNAETTGAADGAGTMEAIYWGSDTSWSKGVGNGPWVCADLESGMYKGNSLKGQSPPASNTSVTGMAYVTAMLKGFSGNHFGLKAANAQSGALQVKWDGTRPPKTGYSPKGLEGAIILGTGGDGSSGGTGTFFEGAITSGVSSDAIDDAIQANIVAAGYGK